MRRLQLVLALVLLLPAVQSSARTIEFRVDDLSQPLIADGVWRFKVGDNLRWADPNLKHSKWDNILAPRDWQRQGHDDLVGYAWYRARFQFDLDNPELVADLDQLGITVGKVHSAYELYVNGERIGGAGQLPPLYEVVYDRIGTYPIARSLIDEEGKMVVAIRVWRDSTLGMATTSGQYEGPVMVGTVFDLTRDVWFKEVIALMLAITYATIGIYHLYLFLRNRQSPEFFWYGLASIMVAVYTLEIAQWKHIVDIYPYEFHKQLEYLTVYLLPAVGLQLVWSMLQYKPGRIPRLYQSGFLLLAGLVALIPGHETRVYSLFPWQLYTLPGMAALLTQILWEALHGNREARLMFVGWIVFVLAALNDILVAQGLLINPRMMSFGFAAVMATMALSLANRYSRMFGQLEEEVQRRTRELRETNGKLLETARLDSLTGLLNRRGFSQKIEAEIARAGRTRRGFVLILADVDNFKLFNDEHGHACGDFVLEELAELLRAQLRDVDVIARWGGEEFMVLLPETALDGGAVLAEKLRAAVEDHPFSFQGNTLQKLTLTMGVAQFHLGMSMDDCLARVDQALQNGKRDGRNRVVVEVTAPPSIRKARAEARREAFDARNAQKS